MGGKLIKCPVCGRTLNTGTAGDSFCRFCGAKLAMDADDATGTAARKAGQSGSADTGPVAGRIAAFRKYRRIGNIVAAVIFVASFAVDRLELFDGIEALDDLDGLLKVAAVILFAAVNLLYYLLADMLQRKS